MVKRILQSLFALVLFWVFWQGIDWACQAVFGIMFLDVILALILVPTAALIAWSVGDFLAGKAIEFDQRRGNI